MEEPREIEVLMDPMELMERKEMLARSDSPEFQEPRE